MEVEENEDSFLMSDQDLPDTGTWSRRREAGGAAALVDPFNSTSTTTTTRLLACGVEDIRHIPEPGGFMMNNNVEEEGAAGSGDEGGRADDERVDLSCSSRIRRRRMEADEDADFDGGYGDSKRKRLVEKHKKKMGGPEETSTSAAVSRKQNQPKKAAEKNPKPKAPKPATQAKSKPNTDKSTTRETRPTPGATAPVAAVIDHSFYKFKDDAAKRSKGGRIRACEVLIGLCPVGGILFVSVEGGYTYAPKMEGAVAENMLVCSHGSVPVQESASRQNKVVEKRPGNFFSLIFKFIFH
jgi:hypothetical protein